MEGKNVQLGTEEKNMALWNMERYNSAEQIKVLVLWNVERFTSVNRKGFGSVERVKGTTQLSKERC